MEAIPQWDPKWPRRRLTSWRSDQRVQLAAKRLRSIALPVLTVRGHGLPSYSKTLPTDQRVVGWLSVYSKMVESNHKELIYVFLRYLRNYGPNRDEHMSQVFVNAGARLYVPGSKGKFNFSPE